MKILSKTIVTLFFLLIPASCCYATSVEFTLREDEQRIKDNIVSFKNSVFLFEHTGKINRNQINKIKFYPPREETTSYFIQAKKDVKEILKQANKFQQKFKDAEGLILLDEEKSILKPDGTRIMRYHFIGKILKPSKKEWARNSIRFDENRQRVNIPFARTIKQDGQVIDLDRTKIKISSPAQGMRHFGRYKILSFTLPEVDCGDICEYIIEKEVFNPWDKKIFDPEFFFQSHEPVLLSKFSVTIPDSLNLHYITRNIDILPDILRKDKTKTYLWEMKEIPPIIDEPYMPGYIDIAPGVFTTTLDSWDYLFDRDAEFIKERMKIAQEIKNLALSITKGSKNKEQKIASIYHWLEKNIRYVSIKGSISSGMWGHPASLTLKNKFGDCVDKAVLFATMLKAIGIEAYPVGVLTNREGSPPREIPIHWCNHAITEIHLNEKIFYLDCTGSNFRYPCHSSSNHGITCLNPLLGKINYIPVPPDSENMKAYNIEIEIDKNGMAYVEFTGRYTGSQEAGIRYYWKRMKLGERKNRIEEVIKEESPNAELLSYEIGSPEDLRQQFFLNWKYKIKDFGIRTKDLLIFRMPELRKYEFEEVGLEKRTYALTYPSSFMIKHRIRLKIPDKYKVEYLPAPFEKSTEYASYKGQYTIEDNDIIFSDELKRKKRIVPVEFYKEYKGFLSKVARYSKEEIFLRK